MSNKRQLYSCITLFCIHLPSCVQPRQDTTKFLHGSFSFFLNVDAVLKIRILANSLTITRTELINGDKVWKWANSLYSREPSKMRLLWGSLTEGGRICESNHKGVFSEKRSGHIYVCNCTFIWYGSASMHRENQSQPPPGKYPAHNNPGYAKPQIVQDIQIT